MHTDSSQYLGVGIGLRPPHYTDLLESTVDVDWLEIISENFMRPGGRPRRVLDQVKERFPIVMHGVSMSIGSADPLNASYMSQLKALERHARPQLLSDHVCWGGIDGKYAHDLLPLPYTEEAVFHLSRRISEAQDRLGRQMLLENVSSYLSYAHSTMQEWDFLNMVTEHSGAALLLDVNNVYVSAHNHGFDARHFIDAIRPGTVKQIHLAGHRTRGTVLIDTHDHPVCDEVWDLYRYTLSRLGPVSTLIEWDADIPDLGILVEEAHKARTLLMAAGAPKQVGRPSTPVAERVP